MNKGFTFIEVLVAMLIFVMAAVAATDLVRGAVRATRDTKEITMATWLLQNLMTELETKISTQGFERGCEKKLEAKFDKPFEDFRWIAYCNEINFHLSDTASQVMQAAGGEAQGIKEDPITRMLLETASDYMSKTLREVHAQVYWRQGGSERMISATTHLSDLKQPLALGSLLPGAKDTDKDGGSG